MRGSNPIRKPDYNDGQVLSVVDIFDTLQGEGPYAGWPATFIRLGGCNLACSFCDTEFEQFAPMALQTILAKLSTKHQTLSTPLVVITGGEPLRQNIIPLCEALISAGYKVQIETNGTLFIDLPPAVSVVCSPKNTGAGYMPVRADLLPRIDAIKFIISAHNADYNDIGEVGQSQYAIPVYVQPMDEYDDNKNKANRDRATELALAHGYRLSLQLHKIVGIA